MKLFHIYEEDLQKLEHSLPRLHDRCGELLNDPEMQVLFGELKEIVSNVRWNYGPHTEVRRIPAGKTGEGSQG